MKNKITLGFVRKFTSGTLNGMIHPDKITFVDRWHCAQWIKGIRRNSRNGSIDYKLIMVSVLN